MEFIIEVTENLIRGGKRASSCYCPVALAIFNTTNYPAMVDTDTIRITPYGFSTVMPEKLKEWIEHYDYQGAGDPIKFKLTLPLRHKEPIELEML